MATATIGTVKALGSPKFRVEAVTFKGTDYWKVTAPTNDALVGLWPLDAFTAEGYPTKGPHTTKMTAVAIIKDGQIIKTAHGEIGTDVLGTAADLIVVDTTKALAPAAPSPRDNSLATLMQALMRYSVKLVKFDGVRYHAVKPLPIRDGEPTYLFPEDKGWFNVGDETKANGDLLSFEPAAIIEEERVTHNGTFLGYASEVVFV